MGRRGFVVSGGRGLSFARLPLPQWHIAVWYNAGKANIWPNRSLKEVNQMAKEPKRIDISQIPELLSIAHEVRSTNEPAVLQQDSEDVAMLTPITPMAKKRVRGQPTSADDPLWKLVGIGHSGKGDISENKHQYLAEAYLHRKQA
jgi:hypothetical protein